MRQTRLQAPGSGLQAQRKKVVVAIAALGIFVSAACSDGETAQPCTDIPAGGCPLSRGVACSDPTCEATYACLPGNTWELRDRCPPRADSGAKDTSAPDVAPIIDAAFDAPPGAYGGPGCGLLQQPDCSLGAALACPAGAGCCNCEDLFVCENGGWVLWGTCGDAGISR